MTTNITTVEFSKVKTKFIDLFKKQYPDFEISDTDDHIVWYYTLKSTDEEVVYLPKEELRKRMYFHETSQPTDHIFVRLIYDKNKKILTALSTVGTWKINPDSLNMYIHKKKEFHFTISKNDKIKFNDNGSKYLSLKNLNNANTQVRSFYYKRLGEARIRENNQDHILELLASLLTVDYKPVLKCSDQRIPISTKYLNKKTWRQCIDSYWSDLISVKFLKHVFGDLIYEAKYIRNIRYNFVNHIKLLVPDNYLSKLYQTSYDNEIKFSDYLANDHDKIKTPTFEIENDHEDTEDIPENIAYAKFNSSDFHITDQKLFYNFLIIYYCQSLKVPFDKSNPEYIMINDYVHDYMKKTLSSVNLNIGPKRMKEIHDEWMMNESKKDIENDPELMPCSIYEGLLDDIDLEGVTEVIHIKDKTRLSMEGITQCNCIYTYRDKISEGRSGIFSIMFKGSRHTADISFRPDQGFRIKQLRKKNNTSSNKELEIYLGDYLSNNIKSNEHTIQAYNEHKNKYRELNVNIGKDCMEEILGAAGEDMFNHVDNVMLT